MVGPAPFVPRYFPGSVPSAPPPYIPSTPSTTSLNGLSQAMAPYTPLISARPPSQPASPNYADFPPPIRPLPMSEVLLADDLPSVPPPSFGEAIASPLTIPINLPLPPGIQSPADSTTSHASSYEDDNDYTAPPEIPVPAPAHTTASSPLPGRMESSDPIHPHLLSDFDQSTPATPHDPPHRNSPHSPNLSNHGVGLAR
ncbi:hypothetical protein ONZ45_g16530 [Pleurotus djamor]|nr:hypothetical protein ONZ45_g16530 [Pleurotus djamor]